MSPTIILKDGSPWLAVDSPGGATITGGVSAIQGSGTVRNAGTIEGGTSEVMLGIVAKRILDLPGA